MRRLAARSEDPVWNALRQGWTDHKAGRASWRAGWQELATLCNPRQCRLTPPGEPVPMLLSADGARGFYLLGLAGLDEAELTPAALRDMVFYLSQTGPGRLIEQDLVPGYYPPGDIPPDNLDWLVARDLWIAPRPAQRDDQQREQRPAPPQREPLVCAVAAQGDPQRHLDDQQRHLDDQQREQQPAAPQREPLVCAVAAQGDPEPTRDDQPREPDAEPDELLAPRGEEHVVPVGLTDEEQGEEQVDEEQVVPIELGEPPPEPQGLAGPCSVCGHLPGSWHKCCPVCSASADGEEDVQQVFGFRTLRGRRAPQTWCRRCRCRTAVPAGQLALGV